MKYYLRIQYTHNQGNNVTAFKSLESAVKSFFEDRGYENYLIHIKIDHKLVFSEYYRIGLRGTPKLSTHFKPAIMALVIGFPSIV